MTVQEILCFGDSLPVKSKGLELVEGKSGFIKRERLLCTNSMTLT